MILAEDIDLSTNPVLRWNFRNIVLWSDANGNVKIAKNTSLDSVDGAVSLAMAIGMYLEDTFNLEELMYTEYSDLLNTATPDAKKDEEVNMNKLI
jgi:phage terminase large subunit-like protein